MAVVAVGYAVGPFILARHLSDLPGLGVVAASLLLTAVATPGRPRCSCPGGGRPTEAVVAVLVLGVVCTAVAFLLFFRLIDEVGPAPGHRDHLPEPGGGGDLGVIFLRRAVHAGIGRGSPWCCSGRAGHPPLAHPRFARR